MQSFFESIENRVMDSPFYINFELTNSANRCMKIGKDFLAKHREGRFYEA